MYLCTEKCTISQCLLCVVPATVEGVEKGGHYQTTLDRRTNVCLYVHTYLCVHVHTCLCVHVHTCLQKNVHTYIQRSHVHSACARTTLGSWDASEYLCLHLHRTLCH